MSACNLDLFNAHRSCGQVLRTSARGVAVWRLSLGKLLLTCRSAQRAIVKRRAHQDLERLSVPGPIERVLVDA